MTRRAAAPRKRNRAEWITFLASSAVVTGLVLAIVFVWMSGSAPAHLAATVQGPPVERDDQWVVEVKVQNRGDVGVADIQVAATLRGEPHGEQFISFLSGGESADIAFVFGENPAELEVEIVSYQDP